MRALSLLVAAACAGSPCPSGREATGWLGACCFPGQRAGLGTCTGTPSSCPDAFRATEGTCVPAPLPPFRAVRIEALTFDMGCDPGRDGPCGYDELPLHEARPAAPYVLMATEVTQSLHEALVGTNPARLAGCPDCPVENVSWRDAARAANALSGWEGLPPAFLIAPEGITFVGGPGWRLPTEVEWEHAARSGTDLPFAGDASRDRVAWHEGNAPGRTARVATLQPTPWGLYDLSGNVWEWTLTAPRPYPEGPEVDPRGPHEGTERVLRGGGWADMPEGLRVAYRGWVDQGHTAAIVGYRLARDARPTDAPVIEPAGAWTPPGTP